MNYNLIIKRASFEDAYVIQKILKNAFLDYINKSGICNYDVLNESIEEIESDILNKETYLIFFNNLAVGTIRLEFKNDNSVYISRFGVLCDFQNYGVGKALMNIADEIISERGFMKAFLHTASKNKDLMRFYYSRGFYVKSVCEDKGYPRVLMLKEY